MLLVLFLLHFLSPEEGYTQPDGKTAVLNYINHHLAKGEVGYGWEDQPDGHLTPAFAAIGILHHLDALPADRSTLVEFVPERITHSEIPKTGKPDPAMQISGSYSTSKCKACSGWRMMSPISGTKWKNGSRSTATGLILNVTACRL